MEGNLEGGLKCSVLFKGGGALKINFRSHGGAGLVRRHMEMGKIGRGWGLWKILSK